MPNLERVRLKGRRGTFLAYLAMMSWAQEAVWYRPRRFLWWRWESWYWRDEIDRVEE